MRNWHGAAPRASCDCRTVIWFPDLKEQIVRFTDVMGLALTALWQRKLRSALTLLGVVFGTFVLVASLSLGQGVQETIVREYSRHNELRNISVLPNYYNRAVSVPEEELRVEGEMNEERRQRLRDALAERWQRRNARGPGVRLTLERLGELRNLDHVESVRPLVEIFGRAGRGKHSEDAKIASADFENDRLRGRLIAGGLPAPGEDRCAVVTEFLLYLMGIRSDAEVEQALGQRVRVEYRIGGRSPNPLLLLLRADNSSIGPDEEKLLDKAVAQLPAAVARMDLSTQEKTTLKKLFSRPPKQPSRQTPERIFSEEYILAGVVRASTADERMRDQRYPWSGADVLLSQSAAQELLLRAPQRQDQGFDRAIVTADRLENVKAVTEAVDGTGLRAFSIMEHVERERFIYLLVFGGMTCIAIIALVVAALGIMNTMLIGVLERTREIGVMKAVGGRDSHILLMFLIEGSLIGLLGGVLGLLVCWLASFPGDAWVRSMVNRQLTLKLEDSLFAYPWWLLVGAPLFAILVTTLAALLPARRASRINPVEALRHE
jgi:putative ABC transport system permease protein